MGCDVLYESQVMTIISRTAKKCECGKVANATDSKCGTVSTGGVLGQNVMPLAIHVVLILLMVEQYHIVKLVLSVI